jgi:hypothetical protein
MLLFCRYCTYHSINQLPLRSLSSLLDCHCHDPPAAIAVSLPSPPPLRCRKGHCHCHRLARAELADQLPLDGDQQRFRRPAAQPPSTHAMLRSPPKKDRRTGGTSFKRDLRLAADGARHPENTRAALTVACGGVATLNPAASTTIDLCADGSPSSPLENPTSLSTLAMWFPKYSWDQLNKVQKGRCCRKYVGLRRPYNHTMVNAVNLLAACRKQTEEKLDALVRIVKMQQCAKKG